MRDRVQSARRIVVKLGTHVVTHDGVELAMGRVFGLVEELASMHRDGRQPLLVSSGSIALGRRALEGIPPRGALSLGMRQAAAAIGQGSLIALYQQALAQFGIVAAQVLLTQEDLGDPERALCLRTTLLRLLELEALPVLNENDSVSVREIVDHDEPSQNRPSFGDNDGLSARVAVAIDADLLVILSDVDGLLTANPSLDPAAERIAELATIDAEVLASASGGSVGGTGGMRSKLEAARLAIAAGVDVLLADGREPKILARLLAGEDLGTFIPSPERRQGRRRDIALARKTDGALVVNAGAVTALCQSKASLLPVGVVEVVGDFRRGDLVEIRDSDHRVLGRGLVNYAADDCRRLAGRRSTEATTLVAERGYDALVTRDNLTLVARQAANP